MCNLVGFWTALVALPLVVLAKENRFKSEPDEALELYGNHPYFMSTPDFYTVEVGKMAVLKCAVTNLEDKQVIWRKASDSNPLTVGLESFYNTNRIVVQHLPRASQWNLVIHDVRLTDSGVYECQVSSKLRHLRQHVLLTVKEKEAETTHMPKPGIKVSGLAYVDIGDQIYLICNATGLEHSPSTIDWFRNGNKLTSRGKKVEIKDFVAVTSRTVVSFLQISDAQLSDSGVYVCRTSNLQIADLRVTVLNSDTSNVKRGTIPGNKDANSLPDKRGPTRQDELSSEDKNTAHARSPVMHRHLLVSISLAIVLARHWLFPS